ncbi:MAG TPA: hypothetical protein VIS04_04605 [Woeseiaceae bacterium]
MRSQFSNDEFAPPEEDDIATRKNRPYHFELEPGQRRHWRDYFAPAFTADQRADTTIWMAGLTTNHDSFVCAAARGLGYKMETLPQPDNTTLTIGKEFGNRGQCNPTYYTVGNLLRKLYELEKAGWTRDDIIRKFLFFTAGSCGPCRFGMYATEYRKALREAGYEGFRIEQMIQNDIVNKEQPTGRGIDFNKPFIKAIVKAFIAGDMLNLMGYRIRPYEIHKGTTNRVMVQCRELVIEALEKQLPVRAALKQCRSLLEQIEVNRMQVKPVVSVIGEIWAMTTEGDGNYQIHEFLEQEGAEVSIQPVYTWLLYLLWEQKRDLRIRTGLRGEDKAHRGLRGKDPWKRMLVTRLLEFAVRNTIRSFARAVGLQHLHIANIEKLAALSHDHYDLEIRGGETFMEVGKFLDIAANRRAHLVISVKPFGCMPSSGVSDGVQSLTTARYPNVTFYAIETTGDGKASVHSRIQMMLFKAHDRARQEYAEALDAADLSAEAAAERLAKNGRLRSALHYPAHRVATTAANLVTELGH